MPEILYAPDQERIVTSNAWAFMHWLRTVREVHLSGWTELQRWSGEASGDFAAALLAFARLDGPGIRLGRHAGTREALVMRRLDGSRLAIDRDHLRGGDLAALPQEIATVLTRLWPTSALIRPLAELLLHADLHPDDRLLVEGPAWPWLAALPDGTTVILSAHLDLLAAAEAERASVLVVPARSLAGGAFQRPRRRPDLTSLRTIIATGGPLSPEGRRRIYTWVKADVLLLARTGDTLWGNPLEPVLAGPPATPALLTPPVSAPAPR